MSNDLDEKKLGEKYLLEVMNSTDPNFLRGMVLEMIVVVGTVYRRLQIHMMLHPVFFLAGFLTCYFFAK
jgi:heptaprenylglyceryl phosphate synthase